MFLGTTICFQPPCSGCSSNFTTTQYVKSVNLVSFQNTSHDLFNSYFKSPAENSQDFCGQDLSIPASGGSHGQDSADVGDSSGGGHQDSDSAVQDMRQCGDGGGEGVESHEIAAASTADQDLRLADGDYQSAAVVAALPHDMRVNAAATSMSDEQPQDLHLSGMFHDPMRLTFDTHVCRTLTVAAKKSGNLKNCIKCPKSLW